MSADHQIKKIIIVGATSGIGRKMAELYAAEGNIVGITGRRKDLLDEIQNMYPGKITTECFDVTGTENIERLKALIQKIGGMDILVYSSGVGEPSKKLEWRIDKPVVDTTVRLNNGGNFLLGGPPHEGGALVLSISATAQ